MQLVSGALATPRPEVTKAGSSSWRWCRRQAALGRESGPPSLPHCFLLAGGQSQSVLMRRRNSLGSASGEAKDGEGMKEDGHPDPHLPPSRFLRLPFRAPVSSRMIQLVPAGSSDT